jgi:hypothetical protein
MPLQTFAVSGATPRAIFEGDSRMETTIDSKMANVIP